MFTYLLIYLFTSCKYPLCGQSHAAVGL